MTLKYQFKVDADAEAFCDRIVISMVRLFGFNLEEALGRINRRWAGDDFLPYLDETDSEYDLRYHEYSEDWAKDITYGADSQWWLDPPGLKPLPYP